MVFEKFFQTLAVLRVHVEGRNVDCQERFASRVPANSQESFVEIEKVSLRCGNKHAFLHVGNERAVFFFGAFALGDVLENVDSAESTSGWIGKRGIGSKKISGKPRVWIIAFTGPSFTIGTIFKVQILLGKKVADAAARVSGEIAASELAQTLIQTDYAELLVVNENGIADGFKRIFPLAMNTIHLFEQADILQSQTKVVCDVGEVGDLIGLISKRSVGPQDKNTEGAFLAMKWEGNEVLQGALGHPSALLLVLLFLHSQNAMILLKGTLGPILFG